MKKKFLLLTFAACITVLTVGCGSKKSNDYSKYVTLGDYKGLTVDRVVTEITDEDVQTQIQDDLALSAEYNEISDRAAQEGDDVVFDLTTTVDGSEQADLSGEEFEIELGSETIVDGFDEQIIGMKTGDTKEFKLTFPTPYDGVVDGKEAVFTVTLKTLYEVSLPEYNDDYVAEITGSEYTTTAQYEAATKKSMEESAVTDAQSMACESALQLIIENSTFKDYPEELLESAKQTLESENQEFADAIGVDVSELFGDDDYDLDEYAKDLVNEKIVVYAIADKEKLAVTDEEYENSLADTLLSSDYDSVEELKKEIDEENYKYEMLYQKVLDFLGENCNFNDVSADEYYEEDEALFEDDGADVEISDEDAGNADGAIFDENADGK